MLLQLREAADHERVLEVRRHQALQKLHIISAKLTEALVHRAAEFAIAFAAVVLNTPINKHPCVTK